ncbi:MAG: tRNA pseudouridine(38-40) synthase TruA [Thermomicrobiales bacterium]
MDETAATSDSAPNRWKLTVAYDGGGFHGSQRQTGKRSVQEDLEHALGVLGGRAVAATFAGRTDSGVHAVGQVVSCDDLIPTMPDATIVRALNAHLADDLAVVAARRVAAGFHARYDATWREYRYRIWLGPRQPLARGIVWERRSGLDVHAMNAGAAQFLGTHDVASFAGGGEGVPWSERHDRPRGTVRTITHCSVRPVAPWWGLAAKAGDAIEIRVVADGFLPRMVRTMVGALVEIGDRSRPRPPDWISQLLLERDRRKGPATAPPHGLVLWRVGYGDDVPDAGDDEPALR